MKLLVPPSSTVVDLGRIKHSDVIICASDEELGFPSGMQQDVEIDGFFLYGLMAVEQLDDSMFRCAIDWFDIIGGLDRPCMIDLELKSAHHESYPSNCSTFEDRHRAVHLSSNHLHRFPDGLVHLGELW